MDNKQNLCTLADLEMYCDKPIISTVDKDGLTTLIDIEEIIKQKV